LGTGERAERNQLGAEICIRRVVRGQCFTIFGCENPAEDHPKGF